MDYDCVSASPGGGGGSGWMGESAARRRQRRVSSPSLRTYLTPAFDAVAAGEDGGGASGYSSSASSSGGLDLGFDASLLRYRRACFSASADIDNRILLYSPQPAQPQPQARAVYSVPDGDMLAAGGCGYGPKRQVSGLTGAPGFHDFKDRNSFISPLQPSDNHRAAAARGVSNSIKPPADLRPRERTITPASKEVLSTPKPEATPSAQATSAQAEPTEEDEALILEVLYGNSGRRRLPVFKDICPE